MRTIHLVLNAHLDPIWLWPWQSGLDEVLSTCRSACDRLDRHPDLFFTRGEAWVYEQVERTDPALFERILAHHRAGRWNLVGGWYIQPDCNLPSGFALRKQIALGKRYFLARFGEFPRIAYNVDSFGHAATLPELMREAGQDCYVMMRPQDSEMSLPARIFRWRGREGGPEVVVFRIAGSYCTPQGMRLPHLELALTQLPEGIEDTMCFAGVGDHGGGPTEEIIRWCREHREALPNARLEFSTPQRFFERILGQRESLPLVTGDLQYHAVGCYSVYRPVKRTLRRAEHLAAQAEVALARDPRPDPQDPARLETAWRRICFHHFHDTLGGTCLASAYPQVEAQLGEALAVSDELLHYSLRRQLAALPADPLQRCVFFNASERAWDGYFEFEPWLEFLKWRPGWELLDEAGQAVPFQLLDSEALILKQSRLLVRLAVPAGGLRILRIRRDGAAAVAPGSVLGASYGRISAAGGLALDLENPQLELPGLGRTPLPRLDLLEDFTDTWSHGISEFAEAPLESARWEPPLLLDQGPLMCSLLQDGRIGESRLKAEWRVYHGAPFVELRLRVRWSESRKVLKLVLPLHQALLGRQDGISGGHLERPPAGLESPIRDFTCLRLAGGGHLGLVAPEVYALDAKPRRVRLTLLRSPAFAHHVPHGGQSPRQRFTDQGEHDFCFRFVGAPQAEVSALDAQAVMLQRPLVFADLTRGMPAGAYRG